MAVKGGIRVPVVTTVDTKDLAKMTGDLEKMKSKVGGINKALRGAAVAAGGAALVAIGAKALDEAKQAFEISRLTDIVVKNTGASAWTSSQQVGALANSISNLTGIDDELVQAGSNVLLSFGNIRNAGTGAAAVFDRATQAAVDMGKALGRDPAVAAKMLGKALADPVKGMVALRKAGITLTNEQQAQIKTMQARGDLLGAQQTILAAVEGRFKGAAAAMATPMEKLQTLVNNLLETLGGPLMAALGPLVAALQPAFEALTPVFEEIGQAVGNLVTQFVKGMKPIMPILIQSFKDFMPALNAVLTIFEAFLPVLQPVMLILAALATMLGKVLPPIVRFLASAFDGLIQVVADLVRMLVPVASRLGPLGKPILQVADALEGVSNNLTDITNMNFDLTASDALATQAANYSSTAVQLQAGAKATVAAGKDFAKAAKKTTSKRVKTPKTAVRTPKTMESQGFTVAGSGGGISLSVTVNGSVVQERDLARTIRNELLVLSRRQGASPAFGV